MKVVARMNPAERIERLHEAILRVLPRETWADAIDLFLETRSFLRKEAEKAHDDATEELDIGGDDTPLFHAISSLAQQDLLKKLGIDDFLSLLDTLVEKKLVSKKIEKEGDLPLYQRAT